MSAAPDGWQEEEAPSLPRPYPAGRDDVVGAARPGRAVRVRSNCYEQFGWSRSALRVACATPSACWRENGAVMSMVLRRKSLGHPHIPRVLSRDVAKFCGCSHLPKPSGVRWCDERTMRGSDGERSLSIRPSKWRGATRGMASSDLVANIPIQTLLRGREAGELQCPTVGRLPSVA
jgi:hypothetical protein